MYQPVINIAKLIKSSLIGKYNSTSYKLNKIKNHVEMISEFFYVLYEKNKIAYIKSIKNPDLVINDFIRSIRLNNPGFLYPVIMSPNNNYFKLDATISESMRIIDPIIYLPLSDVKGNSFNGFYTYYMSKMGLIYMPNTTLNIYGSNGAVLHSFTTQPTIENYTIMWNIKKPSYDIRLGVQTEYLSPVKEYQGNYFFRKKPYSN